MKNVFKVLGIIALVAVIGFGLVSCGGDDDGNNNNNNNNNNNPGGTTVAVTGVTLNKTTLTLAYGGTEKLTATVAPDNATNKAVRWNSTDTRYATVSADGTVTAVEAGTATIFATVEDGDCQPATCKVTVNPAPAVPISDYYGTWKSTTGTNQPFVLTITADSIEWKGNNGSYVKYSNIATWTEDENGHNRFSVRYPYGFAFSGTRTAQGYIDTVTFSFIAMSNDRNSVYLGRDTTTAFTDNTTASYSDTFTKVP
jgi:hypothetical protein